MSEIIWKDGREPRHWKYIRLDKAYPPELVEGLRTHKYYCGDGETKPGECSVCDFLTHIESLQAEMRM
jgi:hypothetical protein